MAWTATRSTLESQEQMHRVAVAEAQARDHREDPLERDGQSSPHDSPSVRFGWIGDRSSPVERIARVILPERRSSTSYDDSSPDETTQMRDRPPTTGSDSSGLEERRSSQRPACRASSNASVRIDSQGSSCCSSSWRCSRLRCSSPSRWASRCSWGTSCRGRSTLRHRSSASGSPSSASAVPAASGGDAQEPLRAAPPPAARHEAGAASRLISLPREAAARPAMGRAPPSPFPPRKGSASPLEVGIRHEGE